MSIPNVSGFWALGQAPLGISQLCMLHKNIQLELTRLYASPGREEHLHSSKHAPLIPFPGRTQAPESIRGVQEESGWGKKDMTQNVVVLDNLYAVPVFFSSILSSPKSDLKIILWTSCNQSCLLDQHVAVLRVHCLHHLSVYKGVCHFEAFVPWCWIWHPCYCVQRRRLARLQWGIILLLEQNFTQLAMACLMCLVDVVLLTLELGVNARGRRALLQLGIRTQVRVKSQGVTARLHYRTEMLRILLLV